MNQPTNLISRRKMIQMLGGGFGALGLATTLGPSALGGMAPPHFRPRARRVIQLFMNGGPFQCDLFDPKPALHKYAGQRPPGADLRTER
jgi:hypothetical protein